MHINQEVEGARIFQGRVGVCKEGLSLVVRRFVKRARLWHAHFVKFAGFQGRGVASHRRLICCCKAFWQVRAFVARSSRQVCTFSRKRCCFTQKAYLLL